VTKCGTPTTAQEMHFLTAAGLSNTDRSGRRDRASHPVIRAGKIRENRRDLTSIRPAQAPRQGQFENTVECDGRRSIVTLAVPGVSCTQVAARDTLQPASPWRRAHVTRWWTVAVGQHLTSTPRSRRGTSAAGFRLRRARPMVEARLGDENSAC
jgi:hypothetical protein